MPLPAIFDGVSIKRFLQGAVVGLVATAFIGFNWAGWMTENAARQMAGKETGAALAAVLGPMCADKFRSGPEATLNLAELKKTASWMQDSYIQKGGWATFPGTAATDTAIAQECAKLLMTAQ